MSRKLQDLNGELATYVMMTLIYSSHTIFSSSVTCICSPHGLHPFFFLSNFLFPFLIFSTATRYFPSLFPINLP